MFPGCFIMIQIILSRLFHWIGVWFLLFLFQEREIRKILISSVTKEIIPCGKYPYDTLRVMQWSVGFFIHHGNLFSFQLPCFAFQTLQSWGSNAEFVLRSSHDLFQSYKNKSDTVLLTTCKSKYLLEVGNIFFPRGKNSLLNWQLLGAVKYSDMQSQN